MRTLISILILLTLGVGFLGCSEGAKKSNASGPGQFGGGPAGQAPGAPLPPAPPPPAPSGPDNSLAALIARSFAQNLNAKDIVRLLASAGGSIVVVNGEETPGIIAVSAASPTGNPNVYTAQIFIDYAKFENQAPANGGRSINGGHAFDPHLSPNPLDTQTIGGNPVPGFDPIKVQMINNDVGQVTVEVPISRGLRFTLSRVSPSVFNPSGGSPSTDPSHYFAGLELNTSFDNGIFVYIDKDDMTKARFLDHGQTVANANTLQSFPSSGGGSSSGGGGPGNQAPVINSVVFGGDIAGVTTSTISSIGTMTVTVNATDPDNQPNPLTTTFNQLGVQAGLAAVISATGANTFNVVAPAVNDDHYDQTGLNSGAPKITFDAQVNDGAVTATSSQFQFTVFEADPFDIAAVASGVAPVGSSSVRVMDPVNKTINQGPGQSRMVSIANINTTTMTADVTWQFSFRKFKGNDNSIQPTHTPRAYRTSTNTLGLPGGYSDRLPMTQVNGDVWQITFVGTRLDRDLVIQSLIHSPSSTPGDPGEVFPNGTQFNNNWDNANGFRYNWNATTMWFDDFMAAPPIP